MRADYVHPSYGISLKLWHSTTCRSDWKRLGLSLNCLLLCISVCVPWSLNILKCQNHAAVFLCHSDILVCSKAGQGLVSVCRKKVYQWPCPHFIGKHTLNFTNQFRVPFSWHCDSNVSLDSPVWCRGAVSGECKWSHCRSVHASLMQSLQLTCDRDQLHLLGCPQTLYIACLLLQQCRSYLHRGIQFQHIDK